METEPFYLLFIFAGFSISTINISIGIIISLLVLLLLLIVSALISGSEVAYFSLKPIDVHKLQYSNSTLSKLVIKLLNHPERLLATILVANNFVNVGIIILSSFIMSKYNVNFFVQVVVVTFVILLVSEIMPKIYANKYSLRFAKLTAPGIKVFNTVFWPLCSILIYSTSIVNKRLMKKKMNISINELSDALELAKDSITEDRKILKGIVKFGNIDVKEIMKSRLDVVAVSIDTKFNELVTIIIESGYSRIPVYDETFDNIKGILYVKDLLPHIQKPATFKWQSLIRPPYFVVETKKINELLKEFQKNKIHLAIAIDEYGGSSGLITLEDILEEIVGEITDESDEEELTFKKIEENKYLFKGKTLLNDFYKVLNIDEEAFDEIKGDADTLAGLILEMKGEIPEKDDSIPYKNFIFNVKAVDDRRIIEIQVEITKNH